MFTTQMCGTAVGMAFVVFRLLHIRAKSHMCMSHVTHVTASCRTYEWVLCLTYADVYKERREQLSEHYKKEEAKVCTFKPSLGVPEQVTCSSKNEASAMVLFSYEQAPFMGFFTRETRPKCAPSNLL